MSNLKLNQVVLDAGTQARVKTSEDVVQDYTELLMQGKEFPPVDVFFDGVDYYLADGFHRYMAHKRAVKDTIAVIIHNGTDRDARIFAASANKGHGLRPTKEDKRNSVMIYLNDYEKSLLSDREIARELDVSHTFVSKLRAQMNEPTKEVKNENNDTLDTKKEREPKYDETEGVVQELSAQVTDLAKENEVLKEKLSISSGDIESEDVIDSLRQEIERLEKENQVLRVSRDNFQAKVAELTRLVNHWKKRAQRAEKETV